MLIELEPDERNVANVIARCEAGGRMKAIVRAASAYV